MSRNTQKTHKILELAHSLRHTQLFRPEDDCYIEGFTGWTDEFREYGSSLEPIVDPTPMYYLGHAWLTVNRYNALVLNTTNMLIADIDFGDPRFNRFAGAADEKEVIAALTTLNALDETLYFVEPHLRFSRQSYRVYQTHSGCRVICTSNPFPQEQCGGLAHSLMLFLKADRKYMELCDQQRCYRARLTPKPWRVSDGSEHVCNLIHATDHEFVHPALAEQLALHDDMTLDDGTCLSCLA